MSGLKLKRMGIDTHQEAVIYMRSDCHICRSEGFEAHTRILVKTSSKSIIATLNVVYDSLLKPGEAGLSEAAWILLSPTQNETATFSHAPTVDSLSDVRKKIYGHRLGKTALQKIIQDIAKRQYSDVELSSFITSCAGNALNKEEITYLTKAMINAGDTLTWKESIVVDKHCVGGLPGNRTSPIVVAIIAAFGLTIPKTSSRAITSPAGTADVMEVITKVNLSLEKIQEVVKKEKACLAWGGAVHLSPADDILIRIEHALDLDSEGLMIASVLSKKKAAGSTHVLIDIPMGETAKVRNQEMANTLSETIKLVGEKIGLKIRTIITDGAQPIGRGIGPALEASDVIAVLKNEANAPADLKEKSILLAGHLLELSGEVPNGKGQIIAEKFLTSGDAFNKFKNICLAQGGFYEPQSSPYQKVIRATQSGVLNSIDNRKLAKIAKLAGAPNDKTAGIYLQTRCGEIIKKGQNLFTLHAESHGELQYALEYIDKHPDIFHIT